MSEADAPTPADAEWFRGMAQCKRALAAEAGDPLTRAQAAAEADALDKLAVAILSPDPAAPPLVIGNGQEVSAAEDPDAPWKARELQRAIRSAPDLLDAEASAERLVLARDAGALAMAVDTAEGVRAATPAEKMLAHGMAAAHALAMRLAARADDFVARRFLPGEAEKERVASTEAARLAVASARMMEASARAALTLDRLRNGGRQVMTVQHVNVGDGGQAVVAGSVTRGGVSGDER